MAPSIILQPYQREDFANIRDLTEEVIRRVVEKLRTTDPAPVRPDDLFSLIASHLPDKIETAESITRIALAFNGRIRQGESLDDFYEQIRDSLQGEFQWTPEELEKWKKIEVAFGDLLSLPIVHLVARAIDLSYEYANLYRGARILTDIRPIFSEDVMAIQGAVISHTLRLRFESADGSHELVVALDDSDIEQLAIQCERGQQKARTARDLMAEKAKVPTMISGENPNDQRN